MENYKKKAALFLVSQSITLFGSSLVSFAIVWYVTMNTKSGAWVGLLTATSYVPQFLISFFSGVWADRYPRRMLIILSDTVIALATLLLVFIFPLLHTKGAILASLIIISIIRSLGAGIQTPAVNCAIPQLVPEEVLMKYNGINGAVQSLVQFCAPAAAGALLSYSTLRSILLIDIITAVIGICLLLTVAIPDNFTKKASSMFEEMKAGISYAYKDSFIGPLLLIFGIFIFLCVPAGFLATLFVNRYYGDTYWYMTLVEIIGFIGMTGGGMLIGLWGGFKNHVKTLVMGMLFFGILAVAMGLVDSFIIYLILMCIYGIALTCVQTASTTLLQENTSIDMQGRVFGLFGSIYSGFLPLGMLVFGPLADKVSMRLLMVTSGVLLLLLSASIPVNRDFYNRGRRKDR